MSVLNNIENNMKLKKSCYNCSHFDVCRIYTRAERAVKEAICWEGEKDKRFEIRNPIDIIISSLATHCKYYKTLK